MKKAFSFVLVFSIISIWTFSIASSSSVINESLNKNSQGSQIKSRIDISKLKFSQEDKKKIMELAILFGKKHKDNIRSNLKRILGDSYYKAIPDKFIISTQIGHLETLEEIAKKLILLGIEIRNAKKNNDIEIDNAAEIETFCYRAAFLHYKKFFNKNLDNFNLSKKFTLMLDMVLCLKYAMHSSPNVDAKIKYQNAAIKSLEDILINLAFHEHKYFSKLFIVYLDDMKSIAKNINKSRIQNVVKIKEQVHIMIEKIRNFDTNSTEN